MGDRVREPEGFSEDAMSTDGVRGWFSEKRDSVSDSLGLLPSQQPQYCPSLTYTQRLYGFGICLGLGILIAILSCIFVFFLMFVPFGVMYTFGNLLSLGSSMFLVGPVKQIKNMCKPVRAITTLIYFVMMGLTRFAAFYVQSGLLVLLFVFLQFCSLFWYTVSYIPYAQQCLCSCFKTTTGLD